MSRKNKIEKEKGKWVIRSDDEYPLHIHIEGTNALAVYTISYLNVSGNVDTIKKEASKYCNCENIVDYLHRMGFKVFQFIYHEGKKELYAGGEDISIDANNLAKDIKELSGCELTAWQKVENRLGIGIICD